MHIKVAARKSDLARLQAYRVGQALRSCFSEVRVEYLFSSSLGDQNQESPLWQMPEKGVFTEDLTKKLMLCECDMVIHSWKDLPTETRDKTEIVATLPRADSRDLILFRQKWCESKSHKIKVFSSSPRRILNVGEFLKWSLPFKSDIEFHTVRGNILTRVNKLLSGEADALILAKAAIDRLLSTDEGGGENEFCGDEAEKFKDVRRVLRLALSQCRWMVTPLTVNPCAPAQGALAIEILKSREDLREILAKINCDKTFRSVQHERDILKKYGGGCHQKIGVAHLSFQFGDVEICRGESANADGRVDSICFSPHDKIKKNTKVVVSNETVDKSKIFPLKMADSVFYKRVSRKINFNVLEDKNLWVAKAEAWPSGYTPSPDQTIWVSGLSTWRKLAAKGIWVNGSQESFGEDAVAKGFDDIECLLGGASDFVKLTHNEGEGLSRYTPCVTYYLEEVDRLPDLRGKTHFYWSSFSGFRRAIVKYPEIRAAQHACGPGHTYKQINSFLGEEPHKKTNLKIYLSHQDWLDSFGGKSC